jgi:HAD superfamily hydrolase (TIGR01509 family)
MIKYVIFDMDGVLCDLVQIHRFALNDALTKICGYSINEYEFWKYYNGIPSEVKLQMLINRGLLEPSDKKKVWNLKQEYTFSQIKQVLKPEQDKIDLHKYLKSKGLKLACVSNSIYKTIELALSVTEQIEYMDIILSNEDFKDKPKPHPFCYLLAMERMNYNKNETLIVEDSEKGIMAAYKSGANVLEVKDTTEVNIKTISNAIDKINIGVI